MIPTARSAVAERRLLRDRFESDLGKILVERGLLTHKGLEDAIRQQVVIGGHLATNLWELGLVSGRMLTRLGAELCGVPEASPRHLTQVSAKVLGLLSSDVVDRTRVLPIAIAGRVLRVGSCEPWDHLALGEVARLAGYPVQCYFVAEVPLVRLLRRHYGIPLRPRFLFPHKALQKPPPPPTDLVTHADEVPWDDLPELSQDIATVVVAGEASSALEIAPAPAPVLEPEPTFPIGSLTAARAALGEADDRDGVGSVVLRFALSRGSRAALLLHRDGEWSGWLAAGEGVDPARLRNLSFTSASGSVFSLVSRTGAYYLGPLTPQPQHQTFLQTLGDGQPGTIAFLPVHFRGKLVFGLYLDAGPSHGVATDIAEVLMLAQSVPATLERLISARVAAARKTGLLSPQP